MKSTRRLFAHGKLTIPVHIREELDLEDGDLVEIEVHPTAEESEAKSR